MRFVTKPEDHKTNKLACQETYVSLNEIAISITKEEIDDGIYRDPYLDEDERRSRVEDQLALSYHNKCAYCERICKADVEHYRPKKKVDDEDQHEGYYWLCYEWTNLLPACVKCNRDGGKHTKFPVLGPRVFHPSFLEDGNLDINKNKANENPLLLERPLLIHPEVDNPEEIFSFELDQRGVGIRMTGIDDDNRGEETIKICKLNRQELRLDRREHVINDFVESVESLFNLFINNRIDMTQLIERIIDHLETLKVKADSSTKTHTLLRKFIIKSPKNFEELVIPFLPQRVRKVVLEAFVSTHNI